MKKVILITFIFILSISAFGCMSGKDEVQPSEEILPIIYDDKIEQDDNSSIIYTNIEFGFKFSLPLTWENFSIVNNEWEGIAQGSSQDGEVTEIGPIITIRHPLWTLEEPYQDIPIMIFNNEQWELVQKEELRISAAPIGPGELGRNSNYIFALPPRYNFSFPSGYEEVDEILEGNPLSPIESE